MKNVLALATHVHQRTPALVQGARLAAEAEGNLTGLYVYQPQTSATPVHSVFDMPEVIAYMRELRHAALEAGPSFVDWSHAEGVAHASWHVVQGAVSDVVAEAGNWHDLLVIGREAARPLGSSSEAGEIVTTCGLPCIVMPEEENVAIRPFERILVAWNGSPESTRAMCAARPLLRRARHVALLRGERSGVERRSSWSPPFEADAWLERNGVKFETHNVVVANDGEGPALERAATDLGTDLLVMGAYGRSRFSERVFGGATRHLLMHARFPLFMRH